jgi:hypothetical protein
MVTRPVNLRFPSDLFGAIQDYAKANEMKVSEVIFTACELFLDANTPGLCPSCHHQNEPSAKFCSECSNPLTEEVKKSENYLKEGTISVTPIHIQNMIDKTLDERLADMVALSKKSDHKPDK